MSVSVTWNGDKFEKELKRDLKRRLTLAAEELVNKVKENINTGRPSSDPYNFPHVDNGFLKNSIFKKFESDTLVHVGSPFWYALWLETGVPVIKPRNAKNLSVPISREAKQTNRATRSQRVDGTWGAGPRDFPRPLTFIPVGRGAVTGLLVEKTTESGKKKRKPTVHYILLRYTRLFPRPFLVPSLEQMRPRIEQIFSGRGQ